MKYLRQAAVLAAVCCAAELLHYILPLPVPTSIYGLLLLFLLLKTGLLKLSHVEDVGNLLLELMPLLLVPATVSVVTALDAAAAMAAPVLLLSFAGTVAVLAAAGWTAQTVIRRKKGDRS